MSDLNGHCLRQERTDVDGNEHEHRFYHPDAGQGTHNNRIQGNSIHGLSLRYVNGHDDSAYDNRYCNDYYDVVLRADTRGNEHNYLNGMSRRFSSLHEPTC